MVCTMCAVVASSFTLVASVDQLERSYCCIHHCMALCCQLHIAASETKTKVSISIMSSINCILLYDDNVLRMSSLFHSTLSGVANNNYCYNNNEQDKTIERSHTV